MSWLNRINNIPLEIITGDGKSYKPLWKNAVKNISYNTEGFEFINVQGTYVERTEQKGNQYPILLYFQGDNCIDEAQLFEVSARDKRPWRVIHPYYDELLVQPLDLSIDNTEHNVSKITGTIWETIEQKYPEDTINAVKEIEIKKAEINLESQLSFVDNIETPQPALIETTGSSISKIGANYNVLVKTAQDAQLLKDKIRTASGAAQGIISDATRYIQQVNDLIDFPFLIIQDINQKVDQMLNTFNDFALVFLSDTNSQKLVAYEAQSTMLLSSLAQNLITTTVSDYNSRTDVSSVITKLNNAYATYLTNLDSNGYLQDKNLALQLDYIINFTLSGLFQIVYESKQERTFILDKDSNAIVLAHRFYGRGDANLDMFIKQNKLSLNEYLQIKKGRLITYYV